MFRATLAIFGFTMLVVAFSIIFVRDLSVPAILIGLGPFATLAAFAGWLVICDLGRMEELSRQPQPTPTERDLPRAA